MRVQGGLMLLTSTLREAAISDVRTPPLEPPNGSARSASFHITMTCMRFRLGVRQL